MPLLPAVEPMEESREALKALTEGVHTREALDMVRRGCGAAYVRVCFFLGGGGSKGGGHRATASSAWTLQARRRWLAGL